MRAVRSSFEGPLVTINLGKRTPNLCLPCSGDSSTLPYCVLELRLQGYPQEVIHARLPRFSFGILPPRGLISSPLMLVPGRAEGLEESSPPDLMSSPPGWAGRLAGWAGWLAGCLPMLDSRPAVGS